MVVDNGYKKLLQRIPSEPCKHEKVNIKKYDADAANDDIVMLDTPKQYFNFCNTSFMLPLILLLPDFHSNTLPLSKLILKLIKNSIKQLSLLD